MPPPACSCILAGGLISRAPSSLNSGGRVATEWVSKCLIKCVIYSIPMDAFHALAEPNRRRVVELLARRGQLSATEICDEFEVTPQAVSQHLRVLREASLINMEKRAQRRIYTFNPKSMNQVQAWLAGIVQLWDRRLDRLDKALKEEAA